MSRWIISGFAAALALATPALATDLTAMTADERTAFRAEVRSYLLDNPEVLQEAIAVLEQREQAAQASADLSLVDTYSDQLFNDGYSWETGNPEADVVVVEFIDYRCGYCRRAHDDVASLIAGDDNIRLIIKEFPILGEDSMQSSRFAIATKLLAGADAYKSVHDALITMRGSASDANLRRVAEDLKLDATAILAHMNSDDVSVEIAANRELAQAMSINGTPTFVMNDQLLRGYVPLDGMKQIVQQLRREG